MESLYQAIVTLVHFGVTLICAGYANMSNASTPYDFSCWPVSEKYDYISLYGKYIGVRQYYNYFVNLYLVDDSFCELWYFKPENKIEKIELYIKYMQELEKT